MFRLSSSVDVGRHHQETVQLRSGIQRIVMETLRMNQGLYLSKLGGLLFSLSNSAELCPIRGHAPSAAGAWAGFPRKSWAPGGPPGARAQLAGAGREAHGRGPGSGLVLRPPERPLLPPRRASPQLSRLNQQMPGTLSLGPFEERRVHARRRWGFLLQVQLRAQQDRREPPEPPSLLLHLLLGGGGTAPPGRAGTVGLPGRCLQTSSVTNLLEGCWQFFLFSTTLLFLMIVHNQCICFPCSSSKRVSL